MKLKRMVGTVLVISCLAFTGCSIGCKHEKVEPATCMKGSVCLSCGETVSDPLGHKAGEWTSEDEADGVIKQTQSCTMCGKTMSERETQTISKQFLDAIPDAFMDSTLKGTLKYLYEPFDASDHCDAKADEVAGETAYFHSDNGKFLGYDAWINTAYREDSYKRKGDDPAYNLFVKTSEPVSIGQAAQKLKDAFGTPFLNRDDDSFDFLVPGTELILHAFGDYGKPSTFIITIADAGDGTYDNEVTIDSLEAVPNELMDSTIKSNFSLFDKTFAETGMNRDDSPTDHGTAFEIPAGCFAGVPVDKAVVVYDPTETGTERPYQLSLTIYNPLAGDGSRETDQLAASVARAVGLNELVKPEGGAVYDYALKINGLDLLITLDNWDGYVSVEITKL